MRPEVDKTGIKRSTSTYMFSEENTMFEKTFLILCIIERLFAKSKEFFFYIKPQFKGWKIQKTS
jgi:hypothetical protein